MPINQPKSAAEIDAKAKIDVQRSLLGSNPFLKNHWLGALVTAFSNRVYDFHLQLSVLLLEMFWTTSSDIYLKIQASWFGITILPATKSTGTIVITGSIGSDVPSNQEYKSSNGNVYTTLNNATIASTTVNVLSITRTGQQATVTTSSDHNLSSNVLVDILGAIQTEYNVTQSAIVVTDTDKFTYTVAGTPVTPATGIITATHVSASVSVNSVLFNSKVNLPANTLVTLGNTISGVDSNAGVDFNQISGGTDQENTVDFRKRFLFRVQNPVAHFNAFAITAEATSINGVTRVFVNEITPAVGQVTIYFMRDNDINSIPSGTEVTKVKNQILTIKPANTSDVDVIVLAPTAVPVNFVFTILSPGTQAMKDAINANLKQYFDELTSVGKNIESDAYRSVIFNTIDLTNGDIVNNFTLTTPPGDVTIAPGEIGTLGAITYSL